MSEDGPATIGVRTMVSESRLRATHLASGIRSGLPGSAARHLAMPVAKGSYLAFLDDDDYYLPGAFEAIRAAIINHPGRPILFRMKPPGHAPVWREKIVRYGNVSTQVVVVPNAPSKIGEWGRYGSGEDLAFIYTTLEKYPVGAVVWEPTVIAARPTSGTLPVDQRPTKRNLIFHIYAHVGNQDWRMNVDRLLKSWYLFNGRKIVGLAVDRNTVDCEEVKAAFGDGSIEWIVNENDPNRGESVTFGPAIQRLRSWWGDELTFYGHAKGTSPKHHVPGGPIECIRRWRTFLYRHALEIGADRIDRVMRRYTVGGALKMHSTYRLQPFRPICSWHYAGTFFWLNHAMFFSLPGALQLGTTRYAVERLAGEIVANENAYCFAGDHAEGLTYRMYRLTPAQWDRLEQLAAEGKCAVIPS